MSDIKFFMLIFIGSHATIAVSLRENVLKKPKMECEREISGPLFFQLFFCTCTFSVI